MPTAQPCPNQLRLDYAHDVAVPADDLFPLLCPVREREWIEGWSCRIVHTFSGLVEPGCVFVTDGPEGEGPTTWITVDHDPALRRVTFVRVTPERRVLLHTLRVEPLGSERCRLHLEYRLTALGEAGREDVRVAAATGEPYSRVAGRLAAAAEIFLARSLAGEPR